jgi:hypothetical protein
MTFTKLPPVNETLHVDFPHFPSRFHAAVFRLWETVSAERIASALCTDVETVSAAAEAMGLPTQKYTERWAERGYITTIRNAWHILPYEQLLAVLGFTEDRLAAVLKDDDFLVVKLGNAKPYCEPITPTVLSTEGNAQLQKIRETVTGQLAPLFSGAAPFDFFAESDRAASAQPVSDDLRMIYSYCGLYANVLDEDPAISYPDTLLSMYRDAGVNAIWFPVMLYQMVPFPFDETRSEGYEMRQENLRTLIRHAKEYGIAVYLYLNEPRSMPLDFFKEHPDLQGKTEASVAALCSSDPRVMEYLRYAVRTLCESVPGIGGFFTITCSENLTHCKSRRGTPCPRCQDISIVKLVSEINTAISEESRRVDPSIRTVVWTWAWDSFMTQEEIRACIAALPKEVIVQCNSEARKPYTIGGISSTIQDYSMSIPGPAPLAESIWKIAADHGHAVSAKVQINVTWECSTVPFLPVFDLIREHMKGLRETGVRHLMLSWTLGGYPSVNLRVASDCLTDPSEARYRALMEQEYGRDADTVMRAVRIFSDAFRAFPFHMGTLYKGPQNAGPSNLLYAEPSGMNATMTCYSFDDLDAWRSIYPREIYRDQLRILSETWREGLLLLDGIENSPLKRAALGGYLLFYSSYLQTDFVMCRESGDTARMLEIIDLEAENARLMYGLMQESALFGYEAANHYYFNQGMLMEKVVSCAYLRDQLLARAEHGTET